VAFGAGLWETVPMANLKKRIPKVGDRLSSPRNASFVVVAVHRNPDVVDLSPLKGSKTLDLVEKGIPWATLTLEGRV
jgi:hypothetical protein